MLECQRRIRGRSTLLRRFAGFYLRSDHDVRLTVDSRLGRSFTGRRGLGPNQVIRIETEQINFILICGEVHRIGIKTYLGCAREDHLVGVAEIAIVGRNVMTVDQLTRIIAFRSGRPNLSFELMIVVDGAALERSTRRDAQRGRLGQNFYVATVNVGTLCQFALRATCHSCYGKQREKQFFHNKKIDKEVNK